MAHTSTTNEAEQYVALPGLYGAPAYGRPPRIVSESERPFDPDDLPIEAHRNEEDREVIARLARDGVGSSLAIGPGSPMAGPAPRRFSLRALTERMRGPNR